MPADRGCGIKWAQSRECACPVRPRALPGAALAHSQSCNFRQSTLANVNPAGKMRASHQTAWKAHPVAAARGARAPARQRTRGVGVYKEDVRSQSDARVRVRVRCSMSGVRVRCSRCVRATAPAAILKAPVDAGPCLCAPLRLLSPSRCAASRLASRLPPCAQLR